MLFGGESLRSLESLVGKAERRARGEEPQADTPEVAVFSHLVRCGRSPRMCAVLEALDRDAARDVFWRLRLTQPQITRVWADRGYAGDRRGRRFALQYMRIIHPGVQPYDPHICLILRPPVPDVS
jgi:hypothetical protein